MWENFMGALTERTAEHRTDVRQCPYARLYDQLDKQDRNTLAGWLEAGESPNWVHQQLRIAGHSIARDSVKLHMDSRCICG